MVKRKHKRKVKAVKRKPVKRRKRAPRKRKVTRVKRVKRRPAKKRAPAKRKRRTGKRVIKQVERRSVERTMTGTRKRRRKRAPRKRRVIMAGTRRRSVGKSGGNKMLIGLAIGAAAIYFLTKGSGNNYGTNYQLPPLTSTQNTTRNTQASNLVQYAVAGGLAIDAIIKLIDKLNTSSDQEVQNTYDVYHTTGEIPGIDNYYA